MNKPSLPHLNLQRGRSTRSLFAIFGAATVIPLLLVVVLPLQMATNALGREGIDRVADTSSVAADAIRLQLEGIRNLTDSYALRPAFRDSSSSEMGNPTGPVRSTLREFQRANTTITYTFLLDANGRVLGSEPWSASSQGADRSERDYYRGALASSGSYVSEAFHTNVGSGGNLITVSRVIQGNDGTVRGVLVAAVDVPSVFQTYVDRFNHQRDVDISIYDQNRHLLAGPGGSPELLTVNNDRIRGASGESWAGTESTNGTKYVSAYSPVGGTGWTVGATVPHDKAFAAMYKLRSSVVLLGVALGGVIVLAVGLLARAIRSREKTEMRLRTSELRTRAILETARQVFCEVDDKGRVAEWNTQAEVVLGWSRDEVLGRDAVEMFFPEDQRHRVLEVMQSMLTSEGNEPRSFKQTSHLLRKNSEEPVPVELSAWVTTVDGHRSVNIFAQDISDRLRLQREQELVVKRQRSLVEELRAADKAKSDFISTVSHELRTPLTSITGYLEMLQEGYGGPLSENQQSMLDVVDRNSHRLLSLIEDVLTLSRIESGSFKMNRVDVDVRTLVTSSVQALLPSVHSKNLDLDIDVASDVGTIMGDGDQLERVILNLLSNAVKFTPDDGRVSVTAFRQERSVMISVSDSGVGIPIDEQHRLFSRFFRASTAHSNAIQGTGLGLTIVKSIVERHGGDVTLQSAPGAGTTVYVELPVVHDAVPAMSSSLLDGSMS